MKYEHMFQLFYFRSTTLYAQDNSIAQSINGLAFGPCISSRLERKLPAEIIKSSENT